MSIFKEIKINVILTAIISAIYGFILIIWPQTTKETICYVVAVALIVIGVIYIIQYIRKDVLKDFYRRELVAGLIYLAIGVIAIVKVDLLTSIIMMLLGMVVLFSGIVKCQYALDTKRLGVKDPNFSGGSGWAAVLALGIINVIFGIVLVIEPESMSNILLQLIGIGLVYSGLTDLVTTLYVERRINKIRKTN